MRIAIIATNMIRIHSGAGKGTEIFVHLFTTELARYVRKHNLPIEITLFAAGDSEVDIPVTSIRPVASSEDPDVSPSLYKLYELSLVSEAFRRSDDFDLFHVHISNGEYVLPIARLVNKPILITMHGGDDDAYHPDYFSQYKKDRKIHFVSISESQKNRLPNVRHEKIIYHGIDVDDTFTFNLEGGGEIMWAGRAVPDKGLDIVMDVIQKVKKPVRIFPLIKPETINWLNEDVLKKRSRIAKYSKIKIDINLSRYELVRQYQTSKLFLFPTEWEEPFGLVIAESMACGTPVVAFARGSVPEIVRDGTCGFIINPSDTDIRGDFIIKKTGLNGLVEAVERIYAMDQSEYLALRRSTREHAQSRFQVKRMVREYVELYNELVKR